MRNVAACIGVMALMLSAGAQATPALAGEDLTADEFTAMIVGKKLHHVSVDMAPLEAYLIFNPNGTLNGAWSSGSKSGAIAGLWKFDGNKVCSTGKTTRKAECVTYRKVDDHFVDVWPNGSLHGVDTVGE